MKKYLLLITLLSIFALGAKFIIKNNQAVASTVDTNLVTVHVDGQTKTQVTKAKTVGEALSAMGEVVSKNDKTEPSLEQQINSSPYIINVYRARPITVIDGVNSFTIMTSERAPENIAKEAGFETNQEDKFSFELPENLFESTPGTELVIKRSKSIILDLYGTSSEVYTHQTSVADFLKERNLKLDPKDELSVPQQSRIINGMTISVARVDKTLETVEESVSAPVEEIKDVNQNLGYKQVKEAGKPGKKLVTYEIVIRNGGEPTKVAIKEVVTEQPTKQVVIVGTKSTNSFTGDFAAALARLRSCESGGRYNINTGNGYYGAYQYDISTWANYGGFRLPSDAPPSVQDEKAWETYRRRGWQPWPSCRVSQGLQDIYR